MIIVYIMILIRRDHDYDDIGSNIIRVMGTVLFKKRDAWDSEGNAGGGEREGGGH